MIIDKSIKSIYVICYLLLRLCLTIINLVLNYYNIKNYYII